MGLKHDSEMMSEALGEGTVHQYFVWNHNQPPNALTSDLVVSTSQVTIIFYEHVIPIKVACKKVVFVPNPDWFREEDYICPSGYVTRSYAPA